MRLFVVDGIKYHRIGDDHYYAQELFEENELFGYLHKNMVETKSTLFTDALRPMEKAKIDCGKAHFKSLGSHVDFAVTNGFEEFTGKYVTCGRVL